MVQERSWEKLKKAVIAIQEAEAISTSLGRRNKWSFFAVLRIRSNPKLAGLRIWSIFIRIQQIRILKSDPTGTYKNQFKHKIFFSHQTYFF